MEQAENAERKRQEMIVFRIEKGCLRSEKAAFLSESPFGTRRRGRAPPAAETASPQAVKNKETRAQFPARRGDYVFHG